MSHLDQMLVATLIALVCLAVVDSLRRRLTRTEHSSWILVDLFSEDGSVPIEIHNDPSFRLHHNQQPESLPLLDAPGVEAAFKRCKATAVIATASVSPVRYRSHA